MFTPLPSEYNNRILCYYMNPSNQIQIARIVDIPNWFFERVVFPKQRLCFEAIPKAYLEIFYKDGLDGVTLSVDNPKSKNDRFHAHCCKISCNLLRVNERMHETWDGAAYSPRLRPALRTDMKTAKQDVVQNAMSTVELFRTPSEKPQGKESLTTSDRRAI